MCLILIFANCLTQIAIEIVHNVTHEMKATLMMGKNKLRHNKVNPAT